MASIEVGILIVLVTSFVCDVTVTAGPVDPQLTDETLSVYHVLRNVAHDRSKVLVGKMNPTLFGAYGGHNPYWTYQHNGKPEAWLFNPSMVHSNHSDELCDPCALTHDFPAVVGFDFATSGDMKEVPIYLMKKAHERGAIVTAAWHSPNIVTNGKTHINDDPGDVLHSIKRLLPGGDHHHQFLAALDGVASVANSMLDARGRHIPIIFRPWHEADGGWFWWGRNNAAHNSDDDIKNIYRETVKYLRDTKGVHNFIYAFSPDCGGSGTDDDIYPGDDYVDVIGADCYLTSSRDDAFFANAVESTVQYAERHGKIAALTEFGPSPAHVTGSFFSQRILNTLTSSASGMRIAYMLTWTNQCYGNSGNCAIYDPYPGHPAAHDYMQFYNSGHTVFLSDLRARYPQLYS